MSVCPEGRSDNVLVIDGFYRDPDVVVSDAHSQAFDVEGNYPGARTALRQRTREALAEAMQHHRLNATWVEELRGPVPAGEEYSGSFQLCLDGAVTWTHRDSFNDWAAVVFLTPFDVWRSAERQH